MSAEPTYRGLSPQGLESILAVTRKLAAPFDLMTMFYEVVEAAKEVLNAESGSVWMYYPETDELVMEVAKGMPPVRVPAGTGIVGACARNGEIINVADCYADHRFSRDVDLRTRTRTRCLLTLPLSDHNGELVGVMQVLNKRNGVFDDNDVVLARALAAQCTVALQRVRMTAALMSGELLRHEIEMAREVQMSTLPDVMPVLPGYDLFGTFRPAGRTGGDTFDLIELEQGLFILIGDATGHGIAPALSATQMQAMLRVAFRLGADLESAFLHVNNQLLEDLPPDRFVTAFVGLLDPATHMLRFHSGGQGPILYYSAATGECARHRPTSFPLAAMELATIGPATAMPMAPGDMLVLVSDGVFEYHNAANEQFGEARVIDLVCALHDRSTAALADALFASVEAFANGAPQDDDMTVVLVKRQAG